MLAALETTDAALLRIPIGSPRMLRLIWLEELVVLLLEVLFEPKSDLRKLVRVVVVSVVVSASDAFAVCNGTTMQKLATARSENERRVRIWVVR